MRCNQTRPVSINFQRAGVTGNHCSPTVPRVKLLLAPDVISLVRSRASTASVNIETPREEFFTGDRLFRRELASV